ncbi:MAG: hypothetical protein A2Y33_16490 [Spirochaetes bacterium GWF1_51_8]|nr:MAG: hypothetical protein A2Y33_16490 [Spirochaetes bacterium GWF1_51_8]
MRIVEADIRAAGPLKKQTVRFGGVNLIVGDNEHGKTTLADCIIHHLTSASKQRGKSPSDTVLHPRFRDSRNVAITDDGNILPDELKDLVPLLVIREGEVRWAWNSGKEIDTKEYWNTDIKEILYGNDGIYTKINKNFSKLLGVQTAASWLHGLRESVARYAGSLRAASVTLLNGHSARERLAALNSEYETVIADWNTMQAGLQNVDLTRKLETAKRFFELTDERKNIASEIDTLTAREPLRYRAEWDGIEKDNSRVDIEIAKLEETLKNSILDKARARDSLAETERDISLKEEALRKTRAESEETKARLLSFEQGAKKPSAAFTPARVILSAAAFMLGTAGIVFSVLCAAGTLLFPWYIPAASSVLMWAASAFLIVPPLLSAGSRVSGDRSAELNSLREKLGMLESIASEKDAELARLLVKRGQIQTSFSDEARWEHERRLAELKLEREKHDGWMREIRQLYPSRERIDSDCARLAALDDRRNNNEAELAKTRAKVTELFHTDSEGFLHEEIKKLREEIAKKSAGREIEFSESRYDEISRKKRALEDEKAALSKTIAESESGALSAGQTAYQTFLRYLDSSEYVKTFYSEPASAALGSNSYKIFEIVRILDDWIAKIDQDIAASTAVNSAYTNIQARVELYLDGVLRSTGFNKALASISGGFYTGVESSTQAKPGRADKNAPEVDIRLMTSGKDVYRFNDLSTGARNMFYFAMRFGIAIDRFRDCPSVFLLDDAFLSFDYTRRVNTLRLLKEYTDTGWQIVYFSVNDRSMESSFAEVFGTDFLKIEL